MAPAWDLDAQGRRKVEPKDETKEKIGRSPDDADAFLLAYYDAPLCVPQLVMPDERPREDSPYRSRDRGGRPYTHR